MKCMNCQKMEAEVRFLLISCFLQGLCRQSAKVFQKSFRKKWNLACGNLAPCLHSGFLSEASVAAAPSEKWKNSGAGFSSPEARNWKRLRAVWSSWVEFIWWIKSTKYCNANWGERSGAGGHLELPPIHGMPHLETFPSQTSSQQTSSQWVCRS